MSKDKRKQQCCKGKYNVAYHHQPVTGWMSCKHFLVSDWNSIRPYRLLCQQLVQYDKCWLFGDVCCYDFHINYNQSTWVNHKSCQTTLLDHFRGHTPRQVLLWPLKWPGKQSCWVVAMKWRHVHNVKVWLCYPQDKIVEISLSLCWCLSFSSLQSSIVGRWYVLLENQISISIKLVHSGKRKVLYSLLLDGLTDFGPTLADGMTSISNSMDSLPLSMSWTLIFYLLRGFWSTEQESSYFSLYLCNFLHLTFSFVLTFHWYTLVSALNSRLFIFLV